MILQSATSGRRYTLDVRNTGGVFLSRTADGATPDQLQSRCLVTEARTNAFSFEVTDADLNNPLVVLRTRPVLQGRAYTLMSSPNGREWEVTCPQDGVYKVRAISTDWPKAQAPILSDATGLAWRFEVGDDGVYQVTSDVAESVRRQAKIKTQDGTLAYQITVDVNGVLTVTDLPFATDAQFYEAELIGPTGTRWLLRVDNAGILSMDSEWQDSFDNGDEWPLVIADRQGTLYCVDTRFGIPGAGRGRSMRRTW